MNAPDVTLLLDARENCGGMSPHRRLLMVVMLNWMDTLEEYARRRRLSARGCDDLAAELAWIDAEGEFGFSEILATFGIDRDRALASPRLSELLRRCTMLLKESRALDRTRHRSPMTWPLTDTQRRQVARSVEGSFKPRSWDSDISPAAMALLLWDDCIGGSLVKAAQKRAIDYTVAYRLVRCVRRALEKTGNEGGGNRNGNGGDITHNRCIEVRP